MFFGDDMKQSTVAGRIAVHIPSHPAANNRGYVLRSRYVMERYLGRRLKSGEEVHHKNENKSDDRIGNLEVLSKAEHSSRHGANRRVLDYEAIEKLMTDGLGYKNIAWILGYSSSSVKSAMRVLRG